MPKSRSGFNSYDVKSRLPDKDPIRSVQSAGALQSILSLSVAYANERIEINRPEGRPSRSLLRRKKSKMGIVALDDIHNNCSKA